MEKRLLIDQATVDKIIDAAQIVDVVSEFVTLKRRGVNYLGLCPFHSDSTPSFSVSPAKNICKCFACGEGGSAVHFIMKHEQLTYYEALKYLAKKYNIEIQERELTDQQKHAYNERESLFIINEYAKDYFINNLFQDLEGKTIGLSYFKERGFREDTIKKFQLGYSLEQRDALTNDALAKGFKLDSLVKVGLTLDHDTYKSDRFRGRVIFPIFTISGRTVGFGGRILKKAENTGKYLNSPESVIYSKSNELYGLFQAKQAITKKDKCFLVEGYTDVLSMHQAGIENVVASSGTALTKGQIRLIHRFTKNVTLLYDGDAAGIKAALRGIDLMLEEEMSLKVVLLPDGEDPDSFARKQNADSFNKYIEEHEVDSIKFKTMFLLKEAGSDPMQRANVITEIVNNIAVIPSDVIRSVYAKDCSKLLNVDERVLVREIGRAFLQKTSKTPAPSAPALAPPPDDLFIPDDAYVGHPTDNGSSHIIRGPFDKYEYTILYFVIRYGTTPLADKNDENLSDENKAFTDVRVIDFVSFDLERDDITFQNPLYKQILEEAIELQDDESFVPNRYFLAHPEAKIAKLAADILSDRYEYSKIHLKQFGTDVKLEDTPLAEEKNLLKNVPLVITELKHAHVEYAIKNLVEELKNTKDDERMMDILKEMKEKQTIKNTLEKVLGERVVLK